MPPPPHSRTQSAPSPQSCSSLNPRCSLLLASCICPLCGTQIERGVAAPAAVLSLWSDLNGPRKPSRWYFRKPSSFETLSSPCGPKARAGSAPRSARLVRPLIGPPLKVADCLIGCPSSPCRTSRRADLGDGGGGPVCGAAAGRPRRRLRPGPVRPLTLRAQGTGLGEGNKAHNTAAVCRGSTG